MSKYEHVQEIFKKFLLKISSIYKISNIKLFLAVFNINNY